MHTFRLVMALIVALTAVVWTPGEAQMHHSAEVDCMAFSENGNYLLTVTRAVVRGDESIATEVRVWDVNVGAVVKKLDGFQERYQKATGHNTFYLTVATCQVEPPILGILDGEKLNLYDWKQQRLAGTKILDKPTWAKGRARLHRSGAIPGVNAAFLEVSYATGPPNVHVFAVPSGNAQPRLEQRTKALLGLPILDGLRTDDANIAFADRVRGAGARLAFVNYQEVGEKLAVDQPQELRVWDEAKGRVIATLPSDLNGPVAISKSGALVATVRGGRAVGVYHAESGRDYLVEQRELLAKKAKDMKVSVRFGYRKGAIGERLVPEAKGSLYVDSDLIVYLDDKLVNIEQLHSEIEAEPDEVVENYTAFFGVENQSDQDVVVDLLIETPISTSDWERVAAFWRLDRKYWWEVHFFREVDGTLNFLDEVEVGRKDVLAVRQNRLLLRRHFGVRAGGAVKDQVALGRREPVDLSIVALSITPVEPGWIADLERMLTAKVDSWESASAIRDKARELLNDPRASGYRRSLNEKFRAAEKAVVGHEQERWRDQLRIDVEISDNYDPDFFNDVTVRVTSMASSDLRVQVGGPNKTHFAVLVPANGTQSHTVEIQRVPREALLFKVVKATVEKR